MLLNESSIAALSSIGTLTLESKDAVRDQLSTLAGRLDISETAFDKLRTAYGAVASYLAEHPNYRGSDLYTQGSIALGTVVRPSSDAHYDVDLVLHAPTVTPPRDSIGSHQILTDLIDALQCHGTYKSMVEVVPKRRCVRLNYSEFHMDITPAMPADPRRASKENPVVVPDIRDGRSDSHPVGYQKWFAEISAKTPSFRGGRIAALTTEIAAKGTVHAFPVRKRKSTLQLLVQLLKRHRDTWSERPENRIFEDCAPISIIISTLAAFAFDSCVTSGVTYDSEIDLMADMLRRFLRGINPDGKGGHRIENPALPHENFADKWREAPLKKIAFDNWYNDAVREFGALVSARGLDEFVSVSKGAFGAGAVKGLVPELATSMNAARTTSNLFMTSSGLLVTSEALAAPRNPPHTFHGPHDASS